LTLEHIGLEKHDGEYPQ